MKRYCLTFESFLVSLFMSLAVSVSWSALSCTHHVVHFADIFVLLFEGLTGILQCCDTLLILK